MAMPLKEFTQLKKLLTLGTSKNDPEALAAWRAATNLIVKNGYTWEMVLSRCVTVTDEVQAMPEDDELLEAFDIAIKAASGSFRQTLLNIQRQHELGGSISRRQRAVVMDAAERAET